MKNGRTAAVAFKLPAGHVTKGNNNDGIFGVVGWIDRHAGEPEYEAHRDRVANGRIFGTPSWPVSDDEPDWRPLKHPVLLRHQDPFGECIEAWYTHDESEIPEDFRPYEQGKDNTAAFERFLFRAKNGDRDAALRMLSTFFIYLNDPHIMPPMMRQFLRELLFLLMQGEDVRKNLGLKKGRGRKRNDPSKEIQVALEVEALIENGETQIDACRKLIEKEPSLTAPYQTQKARKDEPAAGIRRIHNRYKTIIREHRQLPVSPGHLIMLGDIAVKIGPPV